MEVSQPPDEQPDPGLGPDEMSPSRPCGSQDADLDDLPDEQPREEPPRDDELGCTVLEELACVAPLLRKLSGLPTEGMRGLGGDAAEALDVSTTLRVVEVRTEPSECCTRSRTSFQVKPGFLTAPEPSVGERVAIRAQVPPTGP